MSHFPSKLSSKTEVATVECCKHVEGVLDRSGALRKNQYRAKLPFGGVSQAFSHEVHCPICAQIYAYWQLRRLRWRPYPKSLTEGDREEGNSREYADYYDEVYHPVRFENADGSTRNYNNCFFELRPREFGEAHHVLIACLLVRNQDREDPDIDQDIQINVICSSEDDGVRDLFDWYGIPKKPKENQDTAGLDRSSHIIATAFRAADYTSHTYRKYKAISPHERVYESQHQLFNMLSDRLDTYRGSDDDGPRRSDLHKSYFGTSYAAKFWLNRYLMLTNQGKLPKPADIERMAIIHVRRWAKSPVGRVMNDIVLKHVIESIVSANQRAAQAGEACFSHIVLYGDFWRVDFDKLRKDVELVPGGPKLKLILLSSPWPRERRDGSRLVVREDEPDPYCRELWNKFRDQDYDNVPTQVKVFAIWRAFRNRYQHKACMIGHRSGFIEGAAFIGLPVFYLNNERDKLRGNPGPGDLLWKLMDGAPGTLGRLRELGDAMHTFIAIETLKDDIDGANEVERYQNQRRREKSPLSQTPKKDLIVDDRYKYELMAALFMFMCCDFSPRDDDDEEVRKDDPAWLVRVHMMHDKGPTLHELRRAGEAKAAEFFLHAENFVESMLQKPEFDARTQGCGTLSQEVIDRLEQAREILTDFQDDRENDELAENFLGLWRSYNRGHPLSGQEWLRRRYRYAINKPGTELECLTSLQPGWVQAHERAA
ncbi:hypothetical protein CLAFUW4_05746 [Fulvia fulva]|nr:hypothetical protein CLAFUR4_05740 [Fulvia fulva]WPV14849.1 hypothetical protein CLAFUW4_05746 [Fulvia fulva]WPV30357.1 hypothetical protein CLAFUW7_05744 [Fulvia fulva]